MKAVISGQASRFAIVANPTIIHDLSGRSFEVAEAEWRTAFPRCNDLQFVQVESEREAFLKCRELRDADRALRFLLHLFENPVDGRQMTEPLEALLSTSSVRRFVAERLFVDTLPAVDTANEIIRTFGQFPKVTELVGDILTKQMTIHQVRNAFNQSDFTGFENADSRMAFVADVLASPFPYQLVHLVDQRLAPLTSQQHLSAFRFAILKRFSAIPGADRAIDSWVQRLTLPLPTVSKRDVITTHRRNVARSNPVVPAFRSGIKPAVIVVGADKGGVGSTTVSRTILDYFLANNVPTRAFDTESPRGTLKRFHPDITEIVDMTAASDQMKIFDTLNSSTPSVTVVDVRAGLLSTALANLRDIGFLDAAKSGQITFAVFHILGPSIASLDEIAETASFMDGAQYVLVKNFINDTSFFEWDQATYNTYFHRIKDAVEITIPKLNEMAYEQVEVSSVPFLKFVANKGLHDEAANYSFVLRGYVRHWLANVWSEFDRVRLSDIIKNESDKRSN